MQEFSVTFNPENEGAYMVGVAVDLIDNSTGQRIDLTNLASKNIVEVFDKEGNEWESSSITVLALQRDFVM